MPYCACCGLLRERQIESSLLFAVGTNHTPAHRPHRQHTVRERSGQRLRTDCSMAVVLFHTLVTLRRVRVRVRVELELRLGLELGLGLC